MNTFEVFIENLHRKDTTGKGGNCVIMSQDKD